VSGIERVDRFAASSAAVVAIGLWAAAEAILFPIVPDVGLGLLALAAPRHSVRLFSVVLVGALAGSLVMAEVATRAPDTARNALLAVPGIDQPMLDETQGTLTRDGVTGFAQIGPGAPLKAYTVEWIALRADLPSMLVGVILNRITRIGPVLLAAAVVGLVAGAWLRRHSRLALATYAGLWLVFYAVYFLG
jgi:hypothetical protein